MNLEDKSLNYFENDLLISSLIELTKELERYSIPLIVGCGLSLYLRTVIFKKKYSSRYPKRVLQRSTKDIDIFLSSDLIVDPIKIGIIRDTLNSLGYKPVTKYFQFSKEYPSFLNRNILIDILSAPPSTKEENKITIKGVRIKPIGIEEFHAYLVKEAKDISLGLIPVNDLSNFHKDTQISNLYIPSSFNYLILKLHAFRDRVEDASVEFGQHHAYDIFATITNMDHSDWENAEYHLNQSRNLEHIKSSQSIISTFFSEKNRKGILRLQENKLYQRYKTEYDSYLSDFIADLKTLFT